MKLWYSSVDSTKIENLHLIRCELISPSQDCFLVLYTTWEWIRITKECVGVCVTVCIIFNSNVESSTKCGPIGWIPENSIYLLSNQALEWCQSFVISEWKYERLGSTCVATTGLWRIRCEIYILYIEFYVPKTMGKKKNSDNFSSRLILWETRCVSLCRNSYSEDLIES